MARHRRRKRRLLRPVLRELHRAARARAEPHGRAGTGRHSQRRRARRARLALPEVDARLLPVRVRGDHADPDARLDPRPRELQGVAGLRPALDLGRLRRQRVHDLGRRLLRPAGRDRLLGRLRDPSRRRSRRVRRSGGDRPTTCARPRDRRAEQPPDGGDGCRPAVARLERLQRRRPVLRRRRRCGRHPEHEPVHRGGVPRLGDLGLHDRPQAVADRQRQRHDRRPRRDHPGSRFRQRLRRDADRRHRLLDRLPGLQLPEPLPPVPQRRRHARRRSTRTASPASSAA